MNLIEKLQARRDQFNSFGRHEVFDKNDLADAVQTCIDIVKQHQAESGWVSVGNLLPTKEKDYLVRYEQSENFGLYMAVSTFRLDTQKFDCFNSKVTHWMRLPQPPSEAQDD